MLSDEWLPRYRLLENFTAKWNGNGNGNAYDWGDYNSSFALRAVELKSICVVKLMQIKISIFLNFFDVILIFFRSFFDLFSMFSFDVLSFYVLSFLCFCFSMFCRSMFRHRSATTHTLYYMSCSM